ncbi:MAG: peptide-methionine (R)-S-oxide reductase [Spirochaetaceae bacterium]|nr:MAG: peptide-methionine (R)-S-oxide reductase [Spirochaetaceae bacterium]
MNGYIRGLMFVVLVVGFFGLVQAFSSGAGEGPSAVVHEAEAGPVPRYNGEAEPILLDEQTEYEFPIRLTEQQWRERLQADQFATLIQHRTERAFTGRYDGHWRPGIYYSAASGQPLFRSEDKYESGTGWPSYVRPISPDAVYHRIDSSLWTTRIEVIDSFSGAHLGHVFTDGPEPTGLRYCMNSAALVFVPYADNPPENLYDWTGIAELPAYGGPDLRPVASR